MFPLWFKIPGHHLIPHKKAFSKTKQEHRKQATYQARYTNGVEEVEKKRLRNALDHRFERLHKINWPVKIAQVAIFFLAQIFVIQFVQDVIEEAVVYDSNYKIALAEVEQEQRLEDYQTLVHSGQVYLGSKPEYTKEDALLFSKAEFERALRLIPDGIEANSGLRMVLTQLCTRFGTNCETEINID